MPLHRSAMLTFSLIFGIQPMAVAGVRVDPAKLQGFCDDVIRAAVDSTTAATLIPSATDLRDTDATHFSFLVRCKPIGPAILEREGELDPLCADAGGRDRGVIRAGLVQTITGFMAK